MSIFDRFRGGSGQRIEQSESRVNQTYPDVSLEYSDRFSSRRGEVVDFTGSMEKNPMYVSEGGGVIVDSNRELFTDKVFSCIVVFIKGDKANSMIHMTSDSDLAYRKKTEGFDPAQMIINTARVTGENSKILIMQPNFFENLDLAESALSLLEQNLKNKGQTVRREKMKMTGMGAYYSKEKPNEILVFGKENNKAEAVSVSPNDKPTFKWLKL